MSASYRIDPHARLVVIDWRDTSATFPEVRDTLERLLRDPAFGADFGIISDRRQIPAEPDQSTIRQFLNFLGRHAERLGAVRWATVSPSDQPVVFGMGRMAEGLADSYGVSYRVFTDYDEAVAWATARAEMKNEKLKMKNEK